MSTLTIGDLANTQPLDHAAMSTVRGGSAALMTSSPFANVNIGINQNITQLQNVEVNALNNVGVIGAGFGPLHLDVSPSQWANANVAI
jgi:hypothetical protein